MIIYVEGIPASGKSTVLRNISRKFPLETYVIPEYININHGKAAEQTHNPIFFRRNDFLKWKTAKSSKAPFTFVDRGHLSTVIYNLIEFEFSRRVDKLKVLKWYFEDILSYKKIPDYYVFLKTEPKLSLHRRRTLLTTHNMWDKEEALELANEYYFQFIKTFESTIPFFIIETKSLSLQNIEDKIVTHFKIKA